MKNILSIFAMATLVLSGCSDDDNAGNGGDNGSDELRRISVNRSDVDNLPSTREISSVRFVVTYNGENSHYDLLTSSWNNGFSMVLPATVDSRYLSNVSNLLDTEYTNSDVSISNTNAMITEYTYFEAFEDSESIGYLTVRDDSDESTEVWYLYSDRNVKVDGTVKYVGGEDKFDLDLKQGWNRVARKIYQDDGLEKWEWKTKLPSNLQWYFEY